MIPPQICDFGFSMDNLYYHCISVSQPLYVHAIFADWIILFDGQPVTPEGVKWIH